MSEDDKILKKLAERRKGDRRQQARSESSENDPDPPAEDLSNKATLYLLEGTSEMEVDTIIQRIRKLRDEFDNE